VNWFQLVLGLIALAREVIKWLKEREDNARVRVKRIKQMKEAMHDARTSKDTSRIEQLLGDLGMSVTVKRTSDD
jgi:hypothetical protein